MSPPYSFFFFFNDTATPEIYTLSLHDALPIYESERDGSRLFPGKILGHDDRLACVHERVFCKRSGAAPHDPLARLEARDACPELGDLARAFGAGGLCRAARLDAVPDDQLAAIQARRAHANEQLSRAGLGHRRLTQLKSGFPGFGADPIRFHFIASRAVPVSRRMCIPVLAPSTA